ncbi:DUF72 domain-containing protein [Sphingobium subterraneum]|uniref:Uncharacterized protein YecE (DUF72 family) n=1 Tax=Sphingobium subterraneum TaxID=627688 RepID=A0A841J2T5_9SPHN|nr:DUF72 domain-containing protein [Sphingobium subterraneum]MBB6125273.1 uncharacterized protein YecE (DUF72 family) [Sphingobium subterraneum]
MAHMRGDIRVGIGGWTFEPWRGAFYPVGLRQADELSYAAAHLTAIEINGTYYSTFKPESFAKWRDAAPPGFRYAVKASRFCTNRKVLAEAEASVAKFMSQGLTELGDRLGPILWQFAPTKRFDPADFAAFLALLPAQQDGLAMSHAVEVRHASFACAEFVALARKHDVAIVIADHPEYPQIGDLTAGFVYARVQKSREDIPAGYSEAELEDWARIAKSWAEGHAPDGLHYAAAREKTAAKGRDVYMFLIGGAKVRNPVAAQTLIARLG